MTRQHPDLPESHLMTGKEPPPPPEPVAESPFPRLDDVAHAEDVSKKGGAGFQAEYINWSRTAHYLRMHAPGWQPFLERVGETCEVVHRAPDGSGFLLVGFRTSPIGNDYHQTETVVHAIMDHKNKAIPGDKIDARDISDAYVRGMCKAAALLFGLGWQMWSKDDPMERSPMVRGVFWGRELGESGDAPKKSSGGGGAGRPTPPRPKGPAKETGVAATDAQLKALAAMCRKLGIDGEAWAKILEETNLPNSVNRDTLTRFQASTILDEMVKREDAIHKLSGGADG